MTLFSIVLISTLAFTWLLRTHQDQDRWRQS